MSNGELLKIPGFGRRALAEVRAHFPFVESAQLGKYSVLAGEYLRLRAAAAAVFNEYRRRKGTVSHELIEMLVAPDLKDMPAPTLLDMRVVEHPSLPIMVLSAFYDLNPTFRELQSYETRFILDNTKLGKKGLTNLDFCLAELGVPRDHAEPGTLGGY
jgi:hypothetical protein